jgi:tetratricopeptide (TPR) repeat protein
MPLAARHYRLAIEQYERLSGESPERREWQRRIADAWDSLGNIERETEQFEASREALDTAVSIQARLMDESSTPRLQGDLARTFHNRGLLRFQSGKVGEARQDFDRAIELLETALSADPQEPSFRQGFARCLINLGVIYRDQREPQSAVKEYGRAIEILRLLHSELPAENEYASELAQAHMNRGNLLLTFRQQLANTHGDPLAEATSSFQESTRVLRGLSRDYPNVPEYRIQLANGLNGLGAAHQVAGEHDAAQTAFEQARDQFLEILGDGYDSGDVRSRLGLTLANLALLKSRDAPNEKVTLLQKAVEHQQLALKMIPASTTISGYLRSHRRALARAQLQTGDHQGASKQAEELGKLDGGNNAGAKDAAEILASAQQACERDDKLAIEERQRLMEDYARRAVNELRSAVESGSVEFGQLALDSKFISLRDRPDFKNLISTSRKP